VPREPSSPKLALNLALSIVVGAMLGVGIVVLLEMIDRRVRLREDLETELNVPLIAALSTWRPARSPSSGRFGRLASALPNRD
jgi:protein tyrosine kinase modulator